MKQHERLFTVDLRHLVVVVVGYGSEQNYMSNRIEENEHVAY